jgi:uncharacterized protein (TIRG00374 family)
MNRRNLIRALIVSVCLAALTWTVLSLGPAKVLATALQADPWWLGLSVVPIVGRFLIWGFKWRRMLARQAPVSYVLALRTLAAGSFVNLTTPTAKLAGGFLRAALIRRHVGWRLSTAYGWSLADQVTNVLGNLLLFSMLILGLALTPALSGSRLVLLLAALLVLVALVGAAAARKPAWRWIRRPQVSAWLVGWLPARLHKSGTGPDSTRSRLLRSFEPLLHRGGFFDAFAPDLLLAALSFGSICLANAMVLRSLGVDEPLLTLSIAVVLGYFVGVVIGIWGGIGITEAALTGLFVQFGLPLEQAAAGALLHRAVFYLFVIVAGGLALVYEGRVSVENPIDRETAAPSLGDEQQNAGVGEHAVFATQGTDLGVGEKAEQRDVG